MLRTRVLTAIILVPIVIYCVYVGEAVFLALMVLLLTVAEFEFVRMMTHVDFHPTLFFGLGFVWLFLADAYRPDLALLQPGMTLLVLGSLTWQLFHRQGSPVADWALTVVGGLYLGLCGACLIELRSLPDGMWWTLTAIPSVMFADTGAYFIGGAWGRRKLAPALSPGKTWEGYLSGIVIGGLLTGLLAWLWQYNAGPGTEIGVGHGLTLGVLIATLAPLGDLAVSMIKRRANVKDSGNIIPGHGGALDRVDSILWAAVIGYYYVLFVVIGR